MQNAEAKSGNEKFALGVRYVLVAAIAVLAVLILKDARSARDINPLNVPSAQAGIVSAAPGYLVMSQAVTLNDKFYLIDTTKQVICVYHMNGDKIRLGAARDFSSDTEIVDSSVDVMTATGKRIESFEGGTGISVTEAAEYAEGLKKLLEEAEKTKK